MSREALLRAGCFGVDEGRRALRASSGGIISKRPVFREMGLVGVLATQLWHQIYLGGGLYDLSEPDRRKRIERAEVGGRLAPLPALVGGGLF
jgi:asparagine synthase (glutamine-hydrolysing)